MSGEKTEADADIGIDFSADDLMPPSKVHKPVSKAEAALLKQWINEGADYQGHWAFEPVQPSAGGIDALLEQRLQKEGLAFSSEADAATLIRRVTLDLTGLPPTPEEVSSFVIRHSSFVI